MGNTKDPGWEFLTSDDSFYYDDDGNWGSKSDDGTASYYGVDGSWGTIDADGSGSYYGADGSWGTIDADGSGSYYGANGSCDYKFGNGNTSSYASSGSNSSQKASSDSGGSLLGELVGTLLFVGAARVIGSLLNGNSKTTSSVKSQTSNSAKDKPVSNSTAQTPPVNKQKHDPVRKEEKQRRLAEEQRLKEIEKKEHKKAFLAILPFIILLGIVFFLGVGKYMEISKPIPVSISAKDAKGLPYQDVVELLKADGFSNITTHIDYDLVTGWIRDEGAIKSISIDGDSSFKKDDNFPANSKIEIVYHGYKKNNPDKDK